MRRVDCGNIVNAGSRSFEVVGELAGAAAESATVGEIPALDWSRGMVVPLGTEPEAVDEAESRYPIDVAVLQFWSAGEADRVRRRVDRPHAHGAAVPRSRGDRRRA